MSELQFIANTICPYCQRIQILLIDAQIPFRRVELDFTDKPDWFVVLTPLAKVPLVVHEGKAIFESGAILEYLNELSGGGHWPALMQERAIARSWCSVVDRVHDDLRAYFTAKTDADFDSAWRRACERLRRLEPHAASLAFSDERLMLPGVYLGPMFVLLDVLEAGPKPFLAEMPSLTRLSRTLRRHPAVMPVNTEEYQQRILRFLLSAETCFARQATVLRGRTSGEPGRYEVYAARYLEG